MFKKMILDLVATGLSEKEIGDLIGTSQPTVHRIKSRPNSDIRYSLAEKLIRLHAEKCPINQNRQEAA